MHDSSQVAFVVSSDGRSLRGHSKLELLGKLSARRVWWRGRAIAQGWTSQKHIPATLLAPLCAGSTRSFYLWDEVWKILFFGGEDWIPKDVLGEPKLKPLLRFFHCFPCDTVHHPRSLLYKSQLVRTGNAGREPVRAGGKWGTEERPEKVVPVCQFTGRRCHIFTEFSPFRRSGVTTFYL